MRYRVLCVGRRARDPLLDAELDAAEQTLRQRFTDLEARFTIV